MSEVNRLQQFVSRRLKKSSLKAPTPADSSSQTFPTPAFFKAGPDGAPWLEADSDAALSPHFRIHDFAPEDVDVSHIRIHPMLVQKLEELRAALGGCFLMILSGFRSPQSLWWTGSPAEIAHARGLAADVSSPTASAAALAHKAQRVLQGCGSVECCRRSGYIHFEVHPPGAGP